MIQDSRGGETSTRTTFSDDRVRSWWGEHSLAEDSAGRWRIGPLTLYAHRRRHEWRVVVSQGDDPLDDTLEAELPYPAEDIPDPDHAMRFGFVRSPDVIRFTPMLADRSVVVRPESTLLIPAGEKVTVFVSTPLWVRMSFHANGGKEKESNGKRSNAGTTVRATSGAGQPSNEVPVFRPSDTWFGPTTMEGEMCYASRTNAYVSVEECEWHPHRARTVVQVHNRAEDPLGLERLNIPVRHLSLYASDDHSLWTERVTLTRDAAGDLAAMQMVAGPPPETKGAVKLSEPRLPMETNVVVRAFEAFFKEKAG